MTPLWLANEPGQLNPTGGPVAQPLRVEGNNIVNNANVALTTDWTRLFSTVLTYNNGYYDYEQNGGTAANPSQNGLLTRLDQYCCAGLAVECGPGNVFLTGFQYEWVDYLGNEPIAQSHSYGDGPTTATAATISLTYPTLVFSIRFWRI